MNLVHSRSSWSERLFTVVILAGLIAWMATQHSRFGSAAILSTLVDETTIRRLRWVAALASGMTAGIFWLRRPIRLRAYSFAAIGIGLYCVMVAPIIGQTLGDVRLQQGVSALFSIVLTVWSLNVIAARSSRARSNEESLHEKQF